MCVAHSNQRTHVQFDAGKRERWLSTTLLRIACRTVQALFARAYELHDLVHSASAAFSVQILGQLGQTGTHCSTNEIRPERAAKAHRQVQRVHCGMFRCRLALNQHLEHVKRLSAFSPFLIVPLKSYFIAKQG